MARIQRKSSTMSRDADRVQEKKNNQESGQDHLNELTTEVSPVGSLLTTSGEAFSVKRHEALLFDPRFSHPANAEQKVRIMASLQQSYGNTYVQRLINSKPIQAKLTVSSPDDEYEQEAEKVASTIVQAPVFNMPRKAEEEEEIPQGKVKRQGVPEEEEFKPESIGKDASGRIGYAILKNEAIQIKAAGNLTSEIPTEIEMRIKANEGNGQPLSDHVRTLFEPKFGCDFDRVRIHTDTEANELSRELGARAFTTGNDIFFREGDYQPDSESGQGLLAHELTHVVQQSGNIASPVRVIEPSESTEMVTKVTGGTTVQEQDIGIKPVSEITNVVARNGHPAAADVGTVTIIPPVPSYYDVTGDTLAEVGGQLDPEEWGRCGWRFDYKVARWNGSKTAAINITLTLTIRLPRWTGPGWNKASPEAKAEWNRMVSCLMTHENGHADRAKSWAPKLRDKLIDQVEADLTTLWNDGLADHQTEQDAYDASTKHGQTQGVTLDTSIP